MFTTTKTDKGNFVTNEVKKPAKVSESELNSRISKVKNSLTSPKFSPVELTKMYNAITEGRGYTAFSKEGREAWENEFGQYGHGDIRNIANMRTEAFMKTVNDGSFKDHERARELFKNAFECSEAKVRDHFVNEVNVENGRTFRGGPPCNKDLSYEGRMCSTGPVSTPTQLAEKEALCSLMQARWNAQGYRLGEGVDDDDQQFVDRFYDEYAIALQPGGPKIVK